MLKTCTRCRTRRIKASRLISITPVLKAGVNLGHGSRDAMRPIQHPGVDSIR
jgi:hypothetical protein